MSGSADTSSCARVHQVSLFALEAFGFLRADGFAHDCLSVEPLDYKDPCPQAFEACLFQIEYKFNYFKQQALEDFCAQNNIQSASDLELLPGPKVAHAKTLEAEAKQEVCGPVTGQLGTQRASYWLVTHAAGQLLASYARSGRVTR